MIWLMAHMWILLVTAFVVGLVIGWWIWGGQAKPAAPLRNEDSPMGTLESDFTPAPESAKNIE